MLTDANLIAQRNLVHSYLEDMFEINFDDLPEFEKYTDTLLKSIISLKIWNQKLDGLIPKGPNQYVDEMISNLNQIVVMGIIGFKISSYIMIRRSLENIVVFLYYKDHPIEFIKKESGNTNKKNFLRISNLKEYIEEYPFHELDEGYDNNKIKKLVKKIMDNWMGEYKELSNFVHGTNHEYLDLKQYLEDIKPNNETLVSLEMRIQNFSSVANSLNILFFFEVYSNLDYVEKNFIRSSINDELGFKRDLIELFGEI